MPEPLRIVADENIPYAREAFSPLGEVTLLPGRGIDRQRLAGAELLFVRSVTRVGRELLEGLPLRFVGSATAGTDHVDEAWLARAGIPFAAAPGSNAESVAQYIATAWLTLARRKSLTLRGMSVGIVGVGNVGSRVERVARALGMRPRLSDPPLARQTGDPKYRPLDELLDCDILTLHTPLTREGRDPTHHLAGADFFRRLKPGAIFCNAARGAVMDEAALHAALDAGGLGGLILDVWENEPDIDPRLLERCDLGTPHIAGYSFDGKVRGTWMIYEAACRALGRATEWDPQGVLPAPDVPELDLQAGQGEDEALLLEAAAAVYPLEEDDARLRALLDLAPAERPAAFDRQRKQYPRRREFDQTLLRLPGERPALAETAAGLGFRVRA